jgi:hypothetical protein
VAKYNAVQNTVFAKKFIKDYLKQVLEIFIIDSKNHHECDKLSDRRQKKCCLKNKLEVEKIHGHCHISVYRKILLKKMCFRSQSPQMSCFAR